MDRQFLNEIKHIIQSFNESLEAYLPALEKEINTLIETKNTDNHTIETCLDTLLSLASHGIADDLFIKLLEYYKTVDEEGALFYWNEYDDKEN